LFLRYRFQARSLAMHLLQPPTHRFFATAPPICASATDQIISPPWNNPARVKIS
jgi:hypothetical protein